LTMWKQARLESNVTVLQPHTTFKTIVDIYARKAHCAYQI
jgi:hypothetical protein